MCSRSTTTPQLNPGFLDLVIEFFAFCRYLESCTGSALKRKSDSHSLVTSSSSSSTSEDDKPAGATDTAQASSDGRNISNRISLKDLMCT